MRVIASFLDGSMHYIQVLNGSGLWHANKRAHLENIMLSNAF